MGRRRRAHMVRCFHEICRQFPTFSWFHVGMKVRSSCSRVFCSYSFKIEFHNNCSLLLPILSPFCHLMPLYVHGFRSSESSQGSREPLRAHTKLQFVTYLSSKIEQEKPICCRCHMPLILAWCARKNLSPHQKDR